MKSHIIKLAAVTAVAAATLAGPALARDEGAASPRPNSVRAQVTIGEEHASVQGDVKRAEADARRSQKLSERNLRICRSKERSVSRRADQFVRFTQVQLKVFDRKADRVKDFAVAKNRRPADYDSLVAAVDARRAQVIQDLNSFKQSAAGFDCNADNPRGVGTVLQEEAKLVRADLKDYRRAIRDLLVGVKSAKGQAESGR